MDLPSPVQPDVHSRPGQSPHPPDLQQPYQQLPHPHQQPQQQTSNTNPVSMESPNVTPHDHYCLAKEYDRRNRLQDAADLYLKASMNGHLSAMVAYATHLVPTDERAAFVWFRAAAERGDPRAWYELGQLLARGRYFEVNAIDAARCWKRAAQMGDNTGKSALGLCYIRGFGVKQDPDKGVEIVKQVADVHNDVTAMKNLAWIYRHGKGVPKDLKAAEYWEDRAKSQEEVLRHLASREHILFGRGRSRSSKHKRDSADKTSSRPGTREHSASEQTTGLDAKPHFSKDRDSQTNQDAFKVGSELEGKLREVSDERRESSKDFSMTPDVMYREQSFSPNPVRGSHLPESLEGDTSSPKPNQPFGQQSSRTDGHEETQPQFSRKHSDPVFGADAADLSFISKDKDGENPKTEEAASAQAGHSYGNDNQGQRISAAVAISSRAKDIPSKMPRMTYEPPENQLELDNPDVDGNFKSDVSQIMSDARDARAEVEKDSAYESALPDSERDRLGENPSLAAGTTNFSTNRDSDISDAQPDHIETLRQQGAFTAMPPNNLDPGVSTRKKFFESPHERNASDSQEPNLNELLSTDKNTQSYSNRGVQERDHIHVDDAQDNVQFNEREDSEQDYKPEISAVDASDSNEEPTAERSMTSTGRDDGTMTEVTQNTDNMIHRATLHDDTIAETIIDPETLDRLLIVLSSYPPNPMRTDSQPFLKNMVKTIQEVPVSNTEVYDAIDRKFGFYKVIVAMISQHEDEHIQENGLHCLLRILRAMPTSTKESSLLTPYADCFKIVQGNEDVIVPKGTVGVQEDRSGAIQAVSLAMRYHTSTRRIQLAGSAALSEIAATSSTCQTAAVEQGSVSLLLSCLRHRSTPSAAVIHEMAGRAISSFCSGKENVVMKEAFSNAGAVPELLNVLQMWGQTEELPTDLMNKATVCCCCGLRHITDGYSPASIQCVQSYSYHSLIRILVLRKDDVAICTVVLSALTSITRNAGNAAEKSLLEAKPLPEVLATMQVHSHNALFIRKALDFMEALGSFSDIRQEIVVAGGIQFAADIIQQGGNDSLLLERACGVIDKLCKGSTPNQEIFSSHNGMKSLTVLLNSHSRQPAVVERGLTAMSSSSSNNAASQREALLASAPDELVNILGIYSSKNAKVVAACAGSMSALTVPKNIAMAQTFAESRAPELVVRAMKRHPDSAMVQENGSSAVAALCEADPQIASSLLKSGITTILVVALQRFLHKQSAVVQIVRAMRAITNEVIPEDSYRFKSKLLTDRSNESSLPEIFHTALSYHKKSLPDTANVIISICATINRLCMRSVAFKNEVGKDGIVEELKRLVERTAEFKDLGALQPVLATICTLVLESEENKNRFHSVGGVEAILDVMQKWKHDTYVLEHCCAALRYSCNDHFGNCDEVKNHNGVRSILGVMEMHPENVNVTLWCCLTLADLCKGDEELQSSATVVQGIRKVVSAMNMFSTNSRFLSSACEFLRAASVCNTDNQERIVRLGGRTAIVKALENHPTDSALTESAAYALLQIQEIPDPRTSVDSSPQLGLVKRLSRDLRRSGSSSNRSNRSLRSKLGRKSLSFTSRKKTSGLDEDPIREEFSGDEQDHHQEQDPRPRGGITSSLKSLQRLIPRRKSRIERSESSHMVGDGDDFRGAHDGYDEYDGEDDDDYGADERVDDR